MPCDLVRRQVSHTAQRKEKTDSDPLDGPIYAALPTSSSALQSIDHAELFA